MNVEAEIRDLKRRVEDLEGWKETVYLLSSPDAKRLLKSIASANLGKLRA
jgi:hypothetical protein